MKGGLRVTKVNDGTVSLSGKVPTSVRRKFGTKVADSLQGAANSGKPLNKGAIKAIFGGGKGKVIADAIVSFSGKGGSPKGAVMHLNNKTDKNVRMTIRDEKGKLHFKSSDTGLESAARLMNLLGSRKKGTVTVQNPLAGKKDELKVAEARRLSAKEKAAPRGKFGAGLPKMSTAKATPRDDSETSLQSRKDMADSINHALMSKAQLDLAKNFETLDSELGYKPGNTPESVSHKIIYGIKTNSKEVKALAGPGATPEQLQKARDEVRLQYRLSVAKNPDREKAVAANKALHEASALKGAMVLVKFKPDDDTARKGYDSNVRRVSEMPDGTPIPKGVHYGTFSGAEVPSTGNINLLIRDETRRLEGQAAELADQEKRPTAINMHTVERAFVKVGKQWKEWTDDGLVDVADNEPWSKVGMTRPSKAVEEEESVVPFEGSPLGGKKSEMYNTKRTVTMAKPGKQVQLAGKIVSPSKTIPFNDSELKDGMKALSSAMQKASGLPVKDVGTSEVGEGAKGDGSEIELGISEDKTTIVMNGWDGHIQRSETGEFVASIMPVVGKDPVRAPEVQKTFKSVSAAAKWLAKTWKKTIDEI